ncbi:hypothetical protein [Amycolatopsis australiensis]|uniref:Uncharacterized protein n=1 Tax=Amycolatopsis australiensis TaxID=546364 RepID=A0A1K1RRX9_9PSEU|nr:hypothetical protein [Amycolatopsis australiensis]SFW74830.1 hypothetical protein SAMN04489730_3836 [Amycolatopsis australiensis]
MIIRVTFDDQYTRVVNEEVAFLPTQQCKAHRLLPLDNNVLATELTSSTIARLTNTRDATWDRPTTPTPAPPS